MNPFDYLMIPVSIVIGLAIANVLTGIATVMHARERVGAYYWPPLAWAIWLFLVEVQHWWAQWGVHKMAQWTFGAFLLQLIVPVLLFLLSSLVLPPADPNGTIDLRAWYFRNRAWFFALLFFVPVFSVLEEVGRTGHMASALNLVFQVIFIGVVVAGFAVKHARLHEWITAQVMVMTLVYIGLLYMHLPG